MCEKKLVSCVMNNQKTIKSVDFTTDCPKRREGKACQYCYVEKARDINFNAKKVIPSIDYNYEVLRMSKSTVDKLNATGGIRMFSFGDYIPSEQYDKVYAFLSDCRHKKLKVKVITKVPQFVDDFYNDFEDVFSVIHLSIDNIGDGVPHDIARMYRMTYKKVIIRAVILNGDDVEVLNPISDILTFNHADVKIEGKNCINYKRIKTEYMDIIKDTFRDKMCCISGSCETCPIKCKAFM